MRARRRASFFNGATLLVVRQAGLVQARDELGRYFAGALTAFSVPLVFRGSPFEERVWRELVRIP